MDIAVREREQTQATPNGRVRELPPNAEPDMTREARTARAAWRQAHPAAWQRELESLDHYDPTFEYETIHEYTPDWTTDSDYGDGGIHLYEYDGDGILSPFGKRAVKMQERANDALSDLVGLQVDYEVGVRLPPWVITHANRVTGYALPVQKRVRSDLLVLSPQAQADLGRWLDDDENYRLDWGAPPPLLILEILSRGSSDRDLVYKKCLYEAAGVTEYLVYDLGGMRHANSPRELLLFRLVDGRYKQARPDAVDTYRSEVLDTRIRIVPDAQEHVGDNAALTVENRPPPRFQWWDADQDRWRDRQIDAEIAQTAREQEAEARGRLNLALRLLDRVLPTDVAPAELDRLADRWRAAGVPDNVDDLILAVQRAPHEWRSLLGLSRDDDDGDQLTKGDQ